MDKAEFIKRYFAFVDAVGLNALQARVGRHGTLLLLGLRNHIRDLDLELTPQAYNAVIDAYRLRANWVTKWDDRIDIDVEEDLDQGIFVEGVWVTLPEKVLAWMRQQSRPKDSGVIQALEELVGETTA